MAAARAGDLPKAKASLQAALDTDRGDVQAAVELRRLGQTAPIRVVPSTVTVNEQVSTGPGGPLGWSGLAAALVALLLVVVAWRRPRRLAGELVEGAATPLKRQIAEVETGLTSPTRTVRDLVTDLKDAKEQTAKLDGRVEAMRVTVNHQASTTARAVNDLDTIVKSQEGGLVTCPNTSWPAAIRRG